MENVAITHLQSNSKPQSIFTDTKNVFVVMRYTRVEQRIYEVFINEIDYSSLKKEGSQCVRVHKSKLQESMILQQVLRATKTILDKPVHFVEFYAPTKVYFSSILFTRINIDGDYFEFYTHPNVAPYLPELAPKYAPYDLDVIQSLTHIYAVPLYKMLRMYECRKRKTFSYELIELRQLLQVKKGTLVNLLVFKNTTVEAARLAITKHPTHPIDFEYSTHPSFENYTNRRYCTHLYFRIKTPTYHPSPLSIKDYEKYRYVFRSDVV
jgi:plasmid replication initiation protein